MTRRRVLLVLVAAAASLGVLGMNGCSGPLRIEPLQRHDAPLAVDDDLELARRYAPWFLHAVDETRGRQDIPTRMDYDGNLRGDDAWETFPRWELPPTASYAVVRTETHLFISWHLYHPRDWEPVRLGLHLTHENDGENLQVVVDRASGEVVLLYTQAHYVGGVYAGVWAPGGTGEGARGGAGDGAELASWDACEPDELAVPARFGDGGEEIRGPMILLDDEGRPDPRGTHPAVFVQERGHGIYGALDGCAEVVLDADGRARFDEAGLVLRPARPGETVDEPELTGDWSGRVVPYQLESTLARLGAGFRDGSLIGEGGLLDGAVTLETPELTVEVPRYYEADRFSGPFGPDRGIAPFALDFGFDEGEVGALFFDPARRYAECLTVPEPWSTEYEAVPFAE